MFGWINDCCESLVVTKFGMKKWHEIKEKAGCTVQDGGFIRHKYYKDESSVELITAVGSVLGLSVNDVLEVFGQYFMEFTREAGYDNLLSCQGSNLRLWLSNLNALHDHLQDTLPRGRFPQFWCEDDSEMNGTILLYYFSERGSLFVPFVLGLVKEVARYHFDLEITMDLLHTQGENDAEYSTFRIGTLDSTKMYKLTAKSRISSRGSLARNGPESEDVLRDADIKERAETKGCPFHRMQKEVKRQTVSEMAAERFWNRAGLSSSVKSIELVGNPTNDHQSTEGATDSDSSPTTIIPREDESASTIKDETIDPSQEEIKMTDCPVRNHSSACNRALSDEKEDSFLTNKKMETLFPFHVVIDGQFKILQVGKNLGKLIGSTNLVGQCASDIFEIRRPVLGAWNWSTIGKFVDQTFFFLASVGKKKTQLKAHFHNLSAKPKRVLVTIAPDAKNIKQLAGMDLTMSDLPIHTFQRDSIFLGEHMYSGIRSAHKLDKLSRKLAYEHKLSNSLLYSMLPQEVAQMLRAGQAFEPRHHKNMTLFFSDVVGFTGMCTELPPWDIIDMLNRLYTVMDFLAERFCLYKVETIGDAYMCCSGLPEENEKHAEDVANFAIAVAECVQLVKSPLTNQPIRVRIGVHSGSCMSGVVGTMTPHYCLFGDMVNTTSRHESTGEPGKIHCSSNTFGKLTHFTEHPEHYNFSPRGLVDMKGKGKLFTYWLDSAGDSNPFVGPSTLEALRNEAQEMLVSKTWRKRRYFEKPATFLNLPEFDSEDDLGSDLHKMNNNESQRQEVINTEDLALLTDISVLFQGELEDDLSQQIRRQSVTHSRRASLQHTIEESETEAPEILSIDGLDASYYHLASRSPIRALSHRQKSQNSILENDDSNKARSTEKSKNKTERKAKTRPDDSKSKLGRNNKSIQATTTKQRAGSINLQRKAIKPSKSFPTKFVTSSRSVPSRPSSKSRPKVLPKMTPKQPKIPAVFDRLSKTSIRSRIPLKSVREKPSFVTGTEASKKGALFGTSGLKPKNKIVRKRFVLC